MTINKLAMLIAQKEYKKKQVDILAKLMSQKEYKKKQVDIAQIKEILSILSDCVYDKKYDLDDLVSCLYFNGKKRAKRKK